MSELLVHKLQVGLIVDSNSITEWQRHALQNCQDLIQIKLVLSCENNISQKKFFKHGLYYLLNLCSIKNRQARDAPWLDLINQSCQIENFKCQKQGIWQVIDEPTKLLIQNQNLDVLIKFGMNLLKDPQAITTKYGVLSFHHGDPSLFRGRPAGFYELAQNVDRIGAVVQELSNDLDAGKVRAFGTYKIFRHSYRKTLESLFLNSSTLLRQAILNCLNDKTIELARNGENKRLPSNLSILNFVGKLSIRKISHIASGLFLRKDWRIATASSLNLDSLNSITQISLLEEFSKPNGVSFIADPFLLPRGKIICEATKKNSVSGFLITLDKTRSNLVDTSILGPSKHLSFPFVIENQGEVFILPEMAEHGSQTICKIDESDKIVRSQKLLGLENEKLVDPVLLFKDHIWWLFAGKSGSEADQLFLWSSTELLGPYSPHCMNPIVIDPSRARNAGAFVEKNGNLFRVGQDNCRNYGDGITVCQVLQLDKNAYQESPVTRLRIAGFSGPHTYSTSGGNTLVDYYQTIFDPLAWWARVKSKF